ncbi:MAG: penicillin-binding protein activator [Pseudomonadota bacterium]
MVAPLSPARGTRFMPGGVLYLAVAAAMVLIAGCTTTEPTRGPVTQVPPRTSTTPDTEPTAPIDRAPAENFIKPRHFDGTEPVRVALLLPFSATNDSARAIASAMFDAAQLAVFDAGDQNFLLIPKDTKGTPDGARIAARSAVQDGAEMILGPLFSESVEAAAEVTRIAQIPMVAFSSDLKSRGRGVYLLSFPPELEVSRITDFAVLNGYNRFGVLAPRNDYGDRVSGSFAEEVFVRGGVIVHEERYLQDPDEMLEPAKRLAKYSKEVVPLEFRHEFDPNDPQPVNADDADQGYTRGYQAVMMPEQGTLLRALAPLLPYYNVDITNIKLLGVSGWNNPRLTREPALRGGWFAAPDPTISGNFETRYMNSFGAKPPRLSSLAYDATLLAARLATRPDPFTRFSADAIADPNGYFGADGLFRLNPDGSIERGLAILEIQPGGIQVIDPAPRSFADPQASAF